MKKIFLLGGLFISSSMGAEGAHWDLDFKSIDELLAKFDEECFFEGVFGKRKYEEDESQNQSYQSKRRKVNFQETGLDSDENKFDENEFLIESLEEKSLLESASEERVVPCLTLAQERAIGKYFREGGKIHPGTKDILSFLSEITLENQLHYSDFVMLKTVAYENLAKRVQAMGIKKVTFIQSEKHKEMIAVEVGMSLLRNLLPDVEIIYDKGDK